MRQIANVLRSTILLVAIRQLLAFLLSVPGFVSDVVSNEERVGGSDELAFLFVWHLAKDAET